jgi:regulator of nucleoside diphosphate kinase
MEILALERTLTQTDHARLARMIRSDAPAGVDTDRFTNLLESAQLVPSRAISPDFVTMYSQVVLCFAGGLQKKLTLVYPADAEPSEGCVSVFSPVGSALLGLRVGETARWLTPLGDEATGEIVAILFQPEASGDYTL